MNPPCFNFRTQSNVSTENLSDRDAKKLSEKLACCEMFNDLFNFKNLEAIMEMMKFSLGQPLPRALKDIHDMSPNDYEQIFPSSEYLTSLKNMGYVITDFLYQI